MIDRLPLIAPAGYTTIQSIRDDGSITRSFSGHNEIMNGLIQAAAKLFSGDTTYKAAALYFEFQNLAAAGDTPNYPTFEASDGVEYYTGLQYSLTNDFIRVPLLSSPSASMIDAATWRLSVHAITPDSTAGFFAKAFSSAANSVIIGGALVATPVPGTQSSDIILCRNYPTGTKVPKTTGEEISMTWNVEFTLPVSSS